MCTGNYTQHTVHSHCDKQQQDLQQGHSGCTVMTVSATNASFWGAGSLYIKYKNQKKETPSCVLCVTLKSDDAARTRILPKSSTSTVVSKPDCCLFLV